MTDATMTWPTKPLGKVAKIERNSVTPENIRSGSLYVGLENITGTGSFDKVREVANGELASNKFAFSPNHVLYGKLRPYLSKIARPDFSGICSTDILPVLPGKEVDRDYLFYFLRQPEMVQHATARSTGANLPRLSPTQLAQFPVPLPKLEEQKRIAAILDKADTIRRQRQEAISEIDAAFPAFYSYLMRDAETTEHTIQSLIDQKVIVVHKDGNFGGSYPRAEEFGSNGIPFLSAKFVADHGEIIDEDVPRLNLSKARTLPFGWIATNDVLLAHNASVGRVGYYRGEYPEALIGTSLTCFRCDPTRLDPMYLFGTLRSGPFQHQLSGQMAQSTRNQVPITAQRRLSLAVAPIELQRIVREQFQKLFDLRSKEVCAWNESIDLFNSLVQRAFKGEL